MFTLRDDQTGYYHHQRQGEWVSVIHVPARCGTADQCGVYQVLATLDNPTFEAAPASGTLTIHPAVPVVQWASPAAINAGTPLGATQLNATATGVGGASLLRDFTYLPASGTVLPAGAAQPLSVEFISPDGNYTRVIKTVTIAVLAVQTPPPAPGRTFRGFYLPVRNMPVVNRVTAGRAIPVKFSIEGQGGSLALQPGLVGRTAVRSAGNVRRSSGGT